MLSTDALPGAEVTIRTIDGEILPEYEDDEDDPTQRRFDRIVSYVECESQQIFEIHVKLSEGMTCSRSHFHMQFFVDGNFVEGRAIAADSVYQADCYYVSRGISGEKYFFSQLDISDDAPQADEYRSSTLGTIVVKIYQEDKERREDTHPYGNSDMSLLNLHLNPVSEKDVKGRAITQGVGFTPPPDRPMANRRTQRGPRDKDRRPRRREFGVHRDHAKTFTFMFKYRTLEDLKSLYIVQRTPSPSPLDPEYMNRDELKELLEQRTEEFERRQAALREQFKREDSEERVRPRKLPPMSPGRSQYTFRREVIVIDDD